MGSSDSKEPTNSSHENSMPCTPSSRQRQSSGVTIYPSTANTQVVGTNRDPVVTSSSQELYNVVSRKWPAKSKKAQHGRDRCTIIRKMMGPDTRPILRTSFTSLDSLPHSSSTSTSTSAHVDVYKDIQHEKETIIPYGTGFVGGVLRAYQQDMHLVLRPDDVWLAILTQFSFYISSAEVSEAMRSVFVSHEGRKSLVVDVTPATIQTVSIPGFTRAMTGLVSKEVNDGDLVSWLMPDFSTTTDNDRTVAGITVLATVKNYFDFVMLMGCSFPSVTLLGDVGDWELLHRQVQRFKAGGFGEEVARWGGLLDKVTEYFLLSYKNPDDEAVRAFWDRAAHEAGSEGSGLGIKTLSGWLTAFVFWDAPGKKVKELSDDMIETQMYGAPNEDRRRLFLDEMEFPIVNVRDIPSAVVQTPVTVLDFPRGVKSSVIFVAGGVGMSGRWNGEDNHGDGVMVNEVRPRSGWWLVLDGEEPLEM